jgi:type IV secretory pathway VirB10-like protein
MIAPNAEQVILQVVEDFKLFLAQRRIRIPNNARILVKACCDKEEEPSSILEMRLNGGFFRIDFCDPTGEPLSLPAQTTNPPPTIPPPTSSTAPTHFSLEARLAALEQREQEREQERKEREQEREQERKEREQQCKERQERDQRDQERNRQLFEFFDGFSDHLGELQTFVNERRAKMGFSSYLDSVS